MTFEIDGMVFKALRMRPLYKSCYQITDQHTHK